MVLENSLQRLQHKHPKNSVSKTTTVASVQVCGSATTSNTHTQHTEMHTHTHIQALTQEA